MQTREVNVAGVKIGGGNPLALIAGPCAIEAEEACLDQARLVKDAATLAGIGVIFKASFDKANRTSGSSYRGPGMKEGLQILARIKREFHLPILTDVHEPAQCDIVAEVADVLQIPALLCRQTDLIQAAGKTGKAVNVKKGQFMAPGDMRNVVEKIRATDNEDILLTERGTSFGYHYLISDMRALPSMRMLGYPVVFDATHSVQTPGAMGNKSGGERQFVAPLARAAVAAGIDCIFIEVHPDPEKALSDGPTMLRVEDLPALASLLLRIDKDVKAAIEQENIVEAKRNVTRATGVFRPI
ncbi:MAG TPA: 3-deoxy-8-phosphooctulonate synthase [Planctomycetota bacterium]|nr:3-deoxy-8-phosphooctulonate synthase [Planctomycetota bacterium]